MSTSLTDERDVPICKAVWPRDRNSVEKVAFDSATIGHAFSRHTGSTR